MNIVPRPLRHLHWTTHVLVCGLVVLLVFANWPMRYARSFHPTVIRRSAVIASGASRRLGFRPTSVKYAGFPFCYYRDVPYDEVSDPGETRPRSIHWSLSALSLDCLVALPLVLLLGAWREGRRRRWHSARA